MAIPTAPASQKNLWVAASDGDLDRVRDLIENHGMSPNAPDPNTYTPMHAAASYGHVDVLEYLVSRGGDVNVTDEDNDTPIYTVETLDVAIWLIQHGAIINRQNNEGLTPADHLEEEFPDIAAHLRTLLPSNPSDATPNASVPSTDRLPSEHAANRAAEILTENLLAAVGRLEASTGGEGSSEPSEEQIRRAVEEAVYQSMRVGETMGGIATESSPNQPRERIPDERNMNGDDSKRQKREDQS